MGRIDKDEVGYRQQMIMQRHCTGKACGIRSCGNR